MNRYQSITVVNVIYYNLFKFMTVWLGGRVVREPDLQSTGRRFEYQLLHCQLQPWASCLHTWASPPSSIIWYQPMGGDTWQLGMVY